MPPCCLSNQAQLLGLVFKAVRDQPSLQPSLPAISPSHPVCVALHTCSPSSVPLIHLPLTWNVLLHLSLIPMHVVYPEIHATLSSTPVQGPVQGPGHKHYPGCSSCLRRFHRQEWVDEGIDSYILINSGPLASRNRNPFKVSQAKKELIGRTRGFSEHQGKQPSWGSWELGIRELSESKGVLCFSRLYRLCASASSLPLPSQLPLHAHFCSCLIVALVPTLHRGLCPWTTTIGQWSPFRHHSDSQERDSAELRFTLCGRGLFIGCW